MKDVLPTAPEVRQQLARILGSEEFGNATQLRRFPEYVVEEELGGRADKIRAHTIEMTVLGRDDSFDPQVDPVVRIQAGRLHRALERYYLGSGQPDPIRLHIPKGTYVPRFAVRGPAAEPTAGTDSSRSPSFFRRRAVRAAGLAVMVAALLAAWPSMDPFATKDAPRGPRSRRTAGMARSRPCLGGARIG